jgi:hypothetical protein
MTQLVEHSCQGMHLSTLSALYFLLRLLHIVRHKTLVNNIGASLLRTDLPSNPSGIRTKDSEPADNASDLRSTANHGAADNMTEPEDAAAPSSTPEAVDGRYIPLVFFLLILRLYRILTADGIGFDLCALK